MLDEANLYLSGEIPILVSSEYIHVILAKFLKIWPEESTLS
jgi:hypothetical protein